MEKLQIPRARTPESVGVSSKEIVEFLRDIEENDLEFHSFMIIRNGKVAAECFRAPFDAQTPHALYSVSKTFTAVAVGFAVAEGFFSLDTRLIDIFPDYAPAKKDGRLDSLLIRHLITMTSGKNVNVMTDRANEDWVKVFMRSPWYANPGEEFRYINENIYMLSACIRKTTGLTLREFLLPRLFEPLGIDTPFWETDTKGTEAGGWGSYFLTEDFAKVMLCFLGDGKINGKQVFPEGWAQECSALWSDNSGNHDADARVGYGYCIWHNGPRGGYRADGLFSQFGIVFPEQDAVVIATGAIPDEQVARDCIWRHFPKAFTVPSARKTEVPQLNEILASSPIDAPVLSPRSTRESRIEGRTIHVKKKIFLNIIGYPVSVLPLAVTYMLGDKAGNFTDFVFRFGKNECAVSWTEGDEKNTVVCGMDGHQRYGTMALGHIEYLVCCTAEWRNDDELLIHVRPVTTVAKRMLRFHFKANNKVDIFPSSTPSITASSEMLINGVSDLIKSPIAAAVIRKAFSFLPVILDCRYKGKFIN